jgi:hypothetical protein
MSDIAFGDYFRPIVANYLMAPNDRNGSPRRGWHVKEILQPGTVLEGEDAPRPTEWWVEEGLQGYFSLDEWVRINFGPAHQGRYHHGTYKISASEYNGLRKMYS